MTKKQKLRACGVYILSQDGERILLTQRGPAARHEQFKWEGPGGACDPGESYEAAAVREIQEELAVTVTLTGIIWEYESIVDSNNDDWAAKIFQGTIAEQTPSLPDPTKVAGFGWFTRNEINALHETGLLASYAVKDLDKLGWLK